MIRAIILAFVGFMALAAPAHAQSMPFDWPATVGTSSAQVIGANPQRRRIEFYNPNQTAIVAVCPVVARTSGSPAITCTVNGAGSISLLPYTGIRLDGVGGNPQVPSAWNAIANSGGSALTILEYE